MSEPDIVIDTAIYSADSGKVQLRSVPLGMQSVILVEFIPGEGDDDPNRFRVSASRMGDTVQDISELLRDLGESMVDAVKKGDVTYG